MIQRQWKLESVTKRNELKTTKLIQFKPICVTFKGTQSAKGPR